MARASDPRALIPRLPFTVLAFSLSRNQEIYIQISPEHLLRGSVLWISTKVLVISNIRSGHLILSRMGRISCVHVFAQSLVVS